jgi:hypothetical protein
MVQVLGANIIKLFSSFEQSKRTAFVFGKWLQPSLTSASVPAYNVKQERQGFSIICFDEILTWDKHTILVLMFKAIENTLRLKD